MFKISVALLMLSASVVSQNLAKPLTQVQACERFDSAIDGIHAYQEGTGFIVSRDGWILTAAHLVIDPATRQNHGAIQVFMPFQSATQVLSIDDALLHDFALLKVNNSNLPYLQIGNEDDAPVVPISRFWDFP